jgi:hypothetical protein
MKGIALVDLGGLKREEDKAEVEKIDLLWADYHSNIVSSFIETLLNRFLNAWLPSRNCRSGSILGPLSMITSTIAPFMSIEKS